MNSERLMQTINDLAHRNKFVAKKCQGTLIDEMYHRFLNMLNRGREEKENVE